MPNLAFNDKGDAVYYDDTAKSWKPSKKVTNDKGDALFFDGKGWSPGPKAATAQPSTIGAIGSRLKSIGSALNPVPSRAEMVAKMQARGPVTPTELMMDAVTGLANVIVPGEAWWAPVARVGLGAVTGAAGAAIEGKPILQGAQQGAIPMIAGEATPPIVGAITGGPAAARVATQAATEAAEARNLAGTKAAQGALEERTKTGEALGDIADKQRRIESAAREKATQTTGAAATEAATQRVKEDSIKELHSMLGLKPEQVDTLRALPNFRDFRERVDSVKDAYFSGVRSLKDQLGENFNKILPDNTLQSDPSPLLDAVPKIREGLVGKPDLSPAANKLLTKFDELGGQAEPVMVRGVEVPLPPDMARQLGRPTTIGELKTLRAQASKLLSSNNATDRFLGDKATDAIDETIAATAGLTKQQKADLAAARADWKQLNDTFTHQLAGAVSHSTNPAEAADAIFGNLKNPAKSEEQVGLQIVDQLKKNDPQRLPAVRAALAEKIIKENLSPQDMAGMNKNLLKAVFGPSDYGRIEPWFDTKLQITRYENAIKKTPEFQRQWQNEAVKETYTETYHNLENKARDLQGKLESAKTPEEAEKAAREVLPNADEAAIKSLTELKRGKLHERALSYAQRYGVIFALFQPKRTAELAAGYAIAFGPREVFRYALTNPKTASEFWRIVQSEPTQMAVRRMARMAGEVATLKAQHAFTKTAP